MSIHGSRVFARWIKSTLTAGGLTVEIGQKPATVATGAAWSVVYPIAGGTVSGTLENPNEDAVPDIQVTSVSYNAEQTLGQVDRVRALLLAATPAVLADGRSVIFVEPSFADASLARDNDVTPPTFYCRNRFSFRTAP